MSINRFDNFERSLFLNSIVNWYRSENFNPIEQKLITMFTEKLYTMDQPTSFYLTTICKNEPKTECIPREGGSNSSYYRHTYEKSNFLHAGSLIETVQQKWGEKYVQLADSPIRCKNYTLERWRSIETKFLYFLKQHHITLSAQDYQGCNESVYRFTFRIEGQSTLRVLRFSHYFKPFIPLKHYKNFSYQFQSSSSLEQNLLEQAKTFRYTDCTIAFQDGSFWGGHRFILVACSQVFHKMFSSSMLEGGLQPVVDLSHADSKTAQIFISYLYTSVNPFNSNTEDNINIDDLLALSDMYDIQPLFESCIEYIGKELAEDKECSNEDLEVIGQWGVDYENEYLLKVYQYHCWQRGKLISDKAKEIFSQLNIEEYKPKTTQVLICCDTGYGNAIGIRYQDPDLDLSQPKPFINFSWKMTQYFTWTSDGWLGYVPNELPFKFIKVLANHEIIWEDRENRIMEYPKTGTSVKITDIFFG